MQIKKSSLCEAEPTKEHWEKSTYAQYLRFLFYCWLPCASAKCHLCNLVAFSVHLDEEQSVRKYANKTQTALDADVFWVPKYLWCFKFYNLTVLKLRQSGNWKQRWVNHAHKHTKPQLPNKIKDLDLCWKDYFQWMLPLRQWRAASSYCPETALSCLLLPKHGTISTWAAAALTAFSKQKSCETGSFGMYPWPLCFPHAWQVCSTVNYPRQEEPSPGFPSWLPPSAESIRSLCGSTAPLLLFPSFPGTKSSSWGSAGAPIWVGEVLKGSNK